ncbi:MAG: response regulator [Candidatus Levybacteria bacterium]|nr:response regulator [Candidatus Levybacteria bacterium]
MNLAKILIVEDDQLLRDLYVEYLKSEGYIVDIAVDGEEGLLKIKGGGWDLVLLDIILPKLDGIDVMRQFKKLNRPVKKPIVLFLTNLDKDSEIKEALSLGDGYLIKSQLTPEDLLREIRSYLAKAEGTVSAQQSTG